MQKRVWHRKFHLNNRDDIIRGDHIVSSGGGCAGCTLCIVRTMLLELFLIALVVLCSYCSYHVQEILNNLSHYAVEILKNI